MIKREQTGFRAARSTVSSRLIMSRGRTEMPWLSADVRSPDHVGGSLDLSEVASTWLRPLDLAEAARLG
jgi:hypothetical protein